MSMGRQYIGEQARGSPKHVCLWASLQKLSAGDGI